ncbi:NLI interacting factor-like phosphatase-domain-containing protein [Schizophyllum fasciatum]
MDPYDYNPDDALHEFGGQAPTFDPYEDIPPPREAHTDRFGHFSTSNMRTGTRYGHVDYSAEVNVRQEERYQHSDARRWQGEPSYSHRPRHAPRPPYSWEHYERHDYASAPPFPPPHRPRRHRAASPRRQSSPSQSYLSFADRPSAFVHDPPSTRKLLILDLNGSLLVRATWSEPSATAASDDPADRSATVRMRKVYRRPYLQSFQDYIFHPTTRTWLDTMIWSSAQPHNVHDMVDKCFGAAQENFAAIWARDTLGLNYQEYRMKTQTTKDLAIPWRKLRLNPGYGGKPHSASTTLLVDDSPLKARLQPYNHMAIREYDNATLRRDRLAALKDSVRRTTSQKHDAGDQREEDSGVPLNGKRKRSADDEGEDDAKTSDEEDEAEEVGDTRAGDAAPSLSKVERKDLARREHKRRKQERRYTLASTPDSKEGPVPPNARTPSPPPLPEYVPLAGCDATLIAVVGVLDTIKRENNVAGWIRRGALWAGRSATRIVDEVPDAPDGPGCHTLLSPAGDNQTAEDGKAAVDMQLEPGDAPGAGPTEVSGSGLDAAGPASASGGNEGKTTVTASERATDDERNRVPSEGGDATGADAGDPGPDAVSVPLWFENEEVMAHWVDRGVKALAKLGIPLVHGVGGED